MKRVPVQSSTYNEQGIEFVVDIPDNCQKPQIFPVEKCKAVSRHNPECDCRWCVFNREFNQAKGKSHDDGEE